MSTTKNKIVSGIQFSATLPDLAIQLWLFRYGRKLAEDPLWRPSPTENPTPYVGEGRFEHARNIALMLLPTEFEWHKFSEDAMRAFCENEQTAITGAGGTSKSTSAALYSLLFWMCAPTESAVLIASTTIEAAKRRVWKEIIRLYYVAHRKLGNIYGSVAIGNPKPCIRMTTQDGRPDFAHGLYVIAVAKGEREKGINSIKGYHEPRMLLDGDETDSIDQAVVDVRENLRIGCEEFQANWLGNDPSLLNPLGQLMQPERGKPVTVAHKYWISEQGIRCLRFDGYDSPNIPKKKFKGIISQEDIDRITRNGEAANSPMSWVMVRGLHPPEGADETVLSEATLHRFNCFDKVTWQRSFITSASLDPSHGGDECPLRFFKRGNDTTGVFRAECSEIVPIRIDQDDKHNPADYQIAQKTMELCKARAVSPEEFILSTSGLGSGTAGVLMREWSPRIQTCDEGGACSDKIVSEEDPRPAKELYDRRVTELWFSIREFVEADMIRGLDTKTALQLCSRKHFAKGTGSGKRKALEKKEEMIESPNDADALAFYIELLREKGINASIRTKVKSETMVSLQKVGEEYDFDSSEKAYSDPLLEEVGADSDW